MNINIISKTKYRWEYLFLIALLVVVLFFPSLINIIPEFVFLIVIIILFILEDRGYIGYKKVGELKIAEEKIIVEMKHGSPYEITLNDSHKIYTFISQDFDIKQKGFFVYKFFVFVNQRAIINTDLRITHKIFAEFNRHLEAWRVKNNLLVNVVSK